MGWSCEFSSYQNGTPNHWVQNANTQSVRPVFSVLNLKNILKLEKGCPRDNIHQIIPHCGRGFWEILDHENRLGVYLVK